MEKARAHKVPLESVSAWRAALATFAAFVVVGFVPLLAFIVHFFSPATVARPYVWSAGLTAATFFAVGAAKSYFVEQRWYAAGLETLLVGGSAAALAFVVGMLLKGVV